MSTTLDEARKDMIAFGYDADEIEHFEGLARAVFRKEMEKAEAERRQRFEELKRTLGVPVYDEGGGGPEGREEIAQPSRARVEPARPLAGIDGNYGFAHDPADQSREDARREEREAAQLSRAPVGDDVRRCFECGTVFSLTTACPMCNPSAPTPPAKDTGEGKRDAVYDVPIPEGADRFALATNSDLRTIIDGLEQRLTEALDSRKRWNERAATAEIERDEARSSLETAERRIGELEAAIDFATGKIGHALAAARGDRDWQDRCEAVRQRLSTARWSAALTPDAGTARPAEAEEG